MKDSILISIQPKWTTLIKQLIKTFEVRKTKPNLKTPFRCYIYETLYDWCKNRRAKLGQGKVIGEFICDNVEEIVLNYNPIYKEFYYETFDMKHCLSSKQLKEYGKDKPLYAWHISNLVIYDTPKELREFIAKDGKPLSTPPQSWCYVQEVCRD